ncbi:RNA-directed DNA polymerase, eukaryota, reverse transcriptase zinc-binding domain protein [Tanacetum coccineum]
MESLHLSFHNVVTAGLFNGIVLDSSLQLSHLFYAEDVVFIGQWSDSNISTIIHVLDCFFHASGLRINLHKSKLIGIAVDPSSVEAAPNDIGCMALNLPFSYLGINIGGHMSRIKAWDNVTNKVFCRLSKWKMKSFLFDNVLASKEKGGLGVSSFYALNRALIFKWIWRFRTQNNSLWSRVIKAIHGDDGKLGSKPSFSSNWTEIIRDIPLLYNKGIDLLGYMKKDGRTPRGGIEQVQMEDLKSYLEGTILSSMLDRWRWSFSGDGEFSVSSVRSLIDDKILEVVGPKTRWIKYVPIKVNILAWRIKLDYLPTRLNLSRRGIDLESIFCASCNSVVESSSHIFFACSMVKDLYKNIARWWDVNMTELSSYEEWWNWFSNLRFPSKLKMIFEGVFYITWWLDALGNEGATTPVYKKSKKRKELESIRATMSTQIATSQNLKMKLFVYNYLHCLRFRYTTNNLEFFYIDVYSVTDSVSIIVTENGPIATDLSREMM